MALVPLPTASSAMITKKNGSRSDNSLSLIGKTRLFLHEVGVELGKANWPWDNSEKGLKKYRELFDSTGMVIIAMLLLGGYVAFWDLILSSIVGLLSH